MAHGHRWGVGVIDPDVAKRSRTRARRGVASRLQPEGRLRVARVLIDGIEVHHFRYYDAPMPTKNPRLTITMTPSLSVQLRTLSDLTGNSQSSLIAELLEGSGPVFDRMIEVLQAARNAKEAMRGKVAQDLDVAQVKLEKQLGIVMETFDTFTGSLLDESEAVQRRARKQAVGAPRSRSTPLSNRGVRSTPKQPKTSSRSRG